MLRILLDRGAVAIPTPSFFLMDFRNVRAGAVDLTIRENLIRFIRAVWEHPKVRRWQLTGDPPNPPEGLDHQQGYRFAVEAPFRAFARQQGKERWGDKTAPYVHHIDEILAIWPDARVINLARDGRDVGLSVMRLPFGANTPLSAAEDWVAGIEAGLRAEASYPDNVLTVRYEDVVLEPQAQVRRLCAFTALTFSEDLLELERTPRNKIDPFQQDFHPNVYSGINARSVGKWRTQMTGRAQAVFAAVAGPQLERLGYDLGATTPAPTRLDYLGYRSIDVIARFRNFVRHRLVTERGHELRYVLRRKFRRLVHSG